MCFCGQCAMPGGLHRRRRRQAAPPNAAANPYRATFLEHRTCRRTHQQQQLWYHVRGKRSVRNRHPCCRRCSGGVPGPRQVVAISHGQAAVRSVYAAAGRGLAAATSSVCGAAKAAAEGAQHSVEVAARATSLQPPPRTIKAVSLQLSHSMPAAVSPFAEAAAAVPALQTQPSQPAPAAAPAAQPSPQAQQSPFAAAAVQPKQPKQLSPSAGAAQQRAAPAAAATSPFAAEASALSGPPSAASSEAQQLPSRGSAASELARRPSPPHLSTMLDALPMFSAVPSGPSTAQGVAAGPPAAPPASLPGQRPRSPGGLHPPAHLLPKDRISLEQLRSEILGDEALSCSEAQLESVLSSRLPAAGAAAAGAAAAGGASGGAQQPACGSPVASLPSSPSCGHDSDWEIAPNGAQGCRGAGCAAAVLCPRRCLCCTADLHACLRWPCSPHAPPAHPTELEICKRPDGLLWQLGAGGFGRVYKAMRFGCTPVAVVGGRGRGAWVGAAVWHANTGFDPSSCTVCLSSPSSPLLRPAAESHGGALGRGRAVHHGQGSRYAAPAEACVALVVLGSLHMPNSPHWFHCSLQPASEPTPRSFEDFKREARLLQRCKDPHIVSFLGASLNSDFTILVRIAMAVLRHLVVSPVLGCLVGACVRVATAADRDFPPFSLPTGH